MTGRLHKCQVLRVGNRVLVDPVSRQVRFMTRQIIVQPGGMAIVAPGKFLPFLLASSHDDSPGRNRDHPVLLFGGRHAILSCHHDCLLDFVERLPDLRGERLRRDQQRNESLLGIRLRYDVDLHVQFDLATVVERVEVGHSGIITPVFLVHGGEDLISDPAHSVIAYLALKRASIPAELHIYATAAHDFGVRPVDHPCSAWTQSCAHWLEHQGLLKPDSSP